MEPKRPNVSPTVRDTYLPFGKPNFSDAEIAAVTRVLRSGWIGMGPETELFESELAAFVEAPHVVTVNSCTSALFLSLLAAGVSAGDEIVCPSLTWCSTANAAMYLGARPVFCDVNPQTLCASPDDVAAKLTSKTRAVVVVHFGGLAVDVDALRKTLPPRVAIVEDAAHALGARYADGRPVGSSGNPTCFSFYANKNLSTGEGGAVALFDAAAADRIRSLRQHGLPIDAWKRFTHPQTLLLSQGLTELGYKMNYTDLQATLGRVQLARQQEFHDRRLEIAKRYVAGLGRLDPPPAFQQSCTHPSHARHLFVIKLPPPLSGIQRREEIVLALRRKNVGASVHYAPLHLMPLYNGNRAPAPLPVTESLTQSLITLPIGADMTPDDADYVVSHLSPLLAGAAVAPSGVGVER